MTIAQKMLDERRIGYLDGKEDGREEGREEGWEEALTMAISALKGILDPAIIAAQFKVPLERVMDILNCE